MQTFGFDTQSVSVVTQPTAEPLTVAEAREQLYYAQNVQDGYIQNLITTARVFAETKQRRQLMTATLRYSIDSFPLADEILLPRPPLQSVTSITYVDTGGTTQTWDASNYDVDTYSEPGRVALAWAKIWPVTRVVAKAIQIVYVAGFASASDVPMPTKQWMLLAVGALFGNRELSSDVVLNDFGFANSLLESGCWGDYP